MDSKLQNISWSHASYIIILMDPRMIHGLPSPYIPKVLFSSAQESDEPLWSIEFALEFFLIGFQSEVLQKVKSLDSKFEYADRKMN